MRNDVRRAGLAGLAVALVGVACAAADSADDAAGASEDEARIANALSAAPVEIGRDATVVESSGGQMRVLRQGTNGWTCFPDSPRIPGDMPMCTDAAGVAWMQALRTREEPPPGPASVAYMLQGSAFPSFDDPDVREPPDGRWYTTGPVLMIQNVRGRLDGYPAGRSVDRPFVMYRGTPYEHLMIPLGDPAAP